MRPVRRMPRRAPRRMPRRSSAGLPALPAPVPGSGREPEPGTAPLRRRSGAAAAAALAAVCAAGGPAQAADPDTTGYRYWSFWHQDPDAPGTWQYATQGPGTYRPADGEVLGFRFAVSVDAADAHRPRGTDDFGTVCAGTPDPGDGSRRVALVIDFGTEEDAPAGERPPDGAGSPRTACAVIDDGASAAEALAAAAPPLRYNSEALLCAIAGYPARGCGEQVALDPETGRPGGETDREPDGTPAGEPSGDTSGTGGGDGDGSPAAVWTGAGVVALLAAAAVWRARRRPPASS
ncbi:SCO2322 family protein [Streptomyces sp. YIM 98790]|uniref:SCO2322 family protein n=1 Tax=Streptomyces sp. YIM 98790 TaxID=2689077 RepID=UPI001FB7DC3C|nr:SCO2322 family protein [Streptomyces sp. YIM 98790]